MRFIGQNALILVKLGVVLTNTAFGEWIGTEPILSLTRKKDQNVPAILLPTITCNNGSC